MNPNTPYTRIEAASFLSMTKTELSRLASQLRLGKKSKAGQWSFKRADLDKLGTWKAYHKGRPNEQIKRNFNELFPGKLPARKPVKSRQATQADNRESNEAQKREAARQEYRTAIYKAVQNGGVKSTSYKGAIGTHGKFHKENNI